MGAARLGQGWDACEDVLRLTGWSQARRVIVMRRVRKLDLIVEAKRGGRGKGKDQQQAELLFIDENQPVKSWEYAVLGVQHALRGANLMQPRHWWGWLHRGQRHVPGSG